MLLEADKIYQGTSLFNLGTGPGVDTPLLSSTSSGKSSVSEQKPWPAGDVNHYEDIINEHNITITKNPSYAAP